MGSQNITFYLFIHGFGFCYLLLIGVYLCMSKRSAYFPDSNPSPTIRKAAGINSFLWCISFLTSLHFPYTRFTADAQYYNNLSLMADLMVCPGAAYLLYSFLQIKAQRSIFIISQLLLAAGLIVAYAITRDQTWVKCTVVMWGLYAVNFVTFYLRYIKRYQQLLHNQYSEIENKELRWVINFLLFFILYFGLFTISAYYNLPWVNYLTYFLSFAFWTFVAYHVDKQEALDNIWERLNEKVYDNSDAVTQETGGNEEFDLEWVGQRLEDGCMSSEIYLNTDLTLDSLCREIGTNRTYISKYLAHKGITYYSYINSLRARHAARLLNQAGPDANLEDIAFKSGFKNTNTFRRAFKETMGHLPSEHLKS